MARRNGRDRGRIRHAAAVALLTVAVLAPGAARAQTVVDPAGTAQQGGSVETSVTGFTCPGALVPEDVSYLLTPPCDGTSTTYELVFAVGFGAAPGDHPIQIFECGSLPCVASDQIFTLTIEAAVTPSATAASTPDDDDGEDDEAPIGGELILDERLTLLKQAIRDEAEAVFDEIEDLREGESVPVTLQLDVPAELIGRLRGPQLDEEGLLVRHEVTAELTGDGFEIDSDSKNPQGARGIWEWTVRPVTSGTLDLRLEITMTMHGGGVDWDKQKVVPSPDYEVAANWPFKIKRFFAAYWQWLIGTLISLVLAYLGMRKKKPAGAAP